MQKLAPDVYHLSLFPFDSINAYVIGDVLLDAGGRCSEQRLRRELTDVPVRAHALTHVHADHQGPAAPSARRWTCGSGAATRTRRR
jgi:glyoxylase-like metal-dependent hydrolase (beta-lactamase superfamily II)